MRRTIFLATLAISLAAASTAASAICPALPNSLTNGQVADASQVMANFNQLETCLNSGAPVSSLGVTGTGGGIATIQNPSGSTNYNFNLPATAGSPGQVLVSGGGGAGAMTWATVPGAASAPIADGIPVGRPAASAFVWRNPGSATFIDHLNGPITLTIPSQNSDQIRGFEQPISVSPPYTLTVKLTSLLWNANYFTNGIYISDTSGKLITFVVQSGTGSIQVAHWNSTSSFNSSKISSNISPKQSIWLRMTNDGSNLIFYISSDGSEWIAYYSESISSFIGTPAAMGVYGDNNDAASVNLPTKISIWSFELASGSGTNSHW